MTYIICATLRPKCNDLPKNVELSTVHYLQAAVICSLSKNH